MRIGHCQCVCQPGEFESNLRTVCEGLEQAAERGIECETSLRVGRFADEVMAEAREHPPGAVIVTRANRPAWMRRLFGSPVDRIRDELGGHCEIEIV